MARITQENLIARLETHQIKSLITEFEGRFWARLKSYRRYYTGHFRSHRSWY